jgi:branched-chain amino acid transport system ATP-binding protein/neutral amino acid transport system ATP-binding protein
MGLLIVEDVVAGYSDADMVLKRVNFAIAPGEIVCIIGPNGAGKSTLLKTIAGILKPSAGHIRFAGEEIAGRAPRQVAALGLALVPQEQNVFPSLSVRENLEIGGYLEPRQTAARIAASFAEFPELAGKQRQAARGLSGGQRQILAMAMALMVAPKLLLLDEPSAGLAPRAAERLFDHIRSVGRSGVAIAIVEQNALEALAIADRAYILVDGKNSMSGKASEIASDPHVRRIFLGG